MNRILITSSVLILALLVLRQLFRTTISRRVQYALWALVLVRLLVPVNLPAMSISVLNAEPNAQTALTQTMVQEVYLLPVAQSPLSSFDATLTVQPGDTVETGDSFGYSVVSPDGQTVTKYAQRLTVLEILTYIWKVGIFVMACIFLLVNLRFWRGLRKNRIPYAVEGCKYPVYLCDGLPSPCLFGLIHPTIYLTQCAVGSPDRLHHVVAHEEAHARHFDHLWSLLRCVCLSIYWFHPLVWVAAIVSKVDCELACDESALRRLGTDQRLSYGQTLLALIPVHSSPGNPMLSATTMTAGKRQLKERITRIAENRKTVAVAILAMATLVLGISACTFTGPKSERVQPLTGTELAYFNEIFFNAGGYNIRNQFFSSLYEKPEDIDLFQLFYCGIPEGEISVTRSAPESEAELQQVYGGPDSMCPTYKLTTAEMDALLFQYTELTVADTQGLGLEHFTYLPEYDAYYWSHGDSNYRNQITFSSGTREDDLIHLYYNDDYMGGGWKCATLRAAEEGYYFVSNLPSEKPAIPPVLPEDDPVLTIPLDGLPPYEPEPMVVTRHTDDCAQRIENWSIDGHSVQTYRSTDGNFYAAVGYEDTSGATSDTLGVFLTLPESHSVFPFADLFGHSGAVISYFGQISEYSYGPINDYYYFADNGNPILLARAHGDTSSLDLDGDGANELASGTQIFYQRSGKVYEAPLPSLLAEAWPDMNFFDYGIWDTNGRFLTAHGHVTMPGWLDGSAYFQRYLYFTGDTLLVYKDTRATVDHVLGDIDAPEEVLADTKKQILSEYQATKSGEENALYDQNFDDWRITTLYKLNLDTLYTQLPDLNVEVYSFTCQFHSSTPDKVGIAGGAFIDADGWYGGWYRQESSPYSSPYLVYSIQDGQRTLLDSNLPQDASTDSPAFLESLLQTLKQGGLVPPSPTTE